MLCMRARVEQVNILYWSMRDMICRNFCARSLGNLYRLCARAREPARRRSVLLDMPGGLLPDGRRNVRPLPAGIFKPLGGRARVIIVRRLRSQLGRARGLYIMHDVRSRQRTKRDKLLLRRLHGWDVF